MKILPKIFLSLFLCLTLMGICFAEATKEPLPASKVFIFTSHVDKENKIILEWKIAQGYYLYRDKVRISTADDSVVQLKGITLPKGEEHKNYKIFTGTLSVPITLPPAAKGIVKLNVAYQGCSLEGFCYPPMKKSLEFDAANLKNGTVLNENPVATTTTSKPIISDQNFAMSLLGDHNLFVMMLGFLGIGLLLAFTPCVLPMVPILSSIIVNQGKDISTKKAFSLSFMYVIGMAITYAVAGMVVALVGSNIQAALQTPWVIVVFSMLFVLLSFSLFGFYELQLPRAFQNKILALSNKQQGGTYVGVFLMGSLSTLIVSPCVSAPLVGVLSYIGQTGNVVLGGGALLALGFGMGIPLLLIGSSAGKLLPKSGSWMDSVKKIFGILMLGLAIWMLGRVIPAPVVLFLWGILLIGTGIIVGFHSKDYQKYAWTVRGLASVLLVYGVMLSVGSTLGSVSFFHPFEGNKFIASKEMEKEQFYVVKNMEDLNQLLLSAKGKKSVLLDFYADWCVSCVAMDRTIFPRADIKNALKEFILVRADITANNNFDQELLKRFNVIAPPTILYFDKSGRELPKQRIVGEIHPEEFLERILRLKE